MRWRLQNGSCLNDNEVRKYYIGLVTSDKDPPKASERDKLVVGLLRHLLKSVKRPGKRATAMMTRIAEADAPAKKRRRAQD